MTRDERLVFCKKCLNRKMDLQQGLLCKLTDEKAAFNGECADFKRDESVVETSLVNVEGIQAHEVQHSLAPELMEKLRGEQKLVSGVLFGFVVGLLGAILWAIITVSTGYQIGYMAIAIGAGVGFTIRIFGNGVDNIFGIWGGAISLFSVLLGNFLGTIGFMASAEDLDYIEALLMFDYSYLPDVMMETFSFMDLVFYGIAVYEGYKFSFRLITEESIRELEAK